MIGTINALEERLEDVTVPMDVSIIGCVVNGPGEAKVSDLGLTGGTPNNLLYEDGRVSRKVGQEELVDNLERLIRAKAQARQRGEDTDIIATSRENTQ